MYTYTHHTQRISRSPSDEGEEEGEVEDRGRPHGQLVTRHMIRKWVKRLTKVRLVVKAR